jgi:hypothetical protein
VRLIAGAEARDCTLYRYYESLQRTLDQFVTALAFGGDGHFGISAIPFCIAWLDDGRWAHDSIAGGNMQGEPTNTPENGCLQKRVRTATAAGLGGLKAFSPYAWVPILFVSIISATLAYRNFSAQQSGNRPEMIFNRVNLQNPYDDDGLFDLGMLNVGTRTAYNYRLVIKTAELVAGKSTTLTNVTSSNPIRRDGGASVAPHLE